MKLTKKVVNNLFFCCGIAAVVIMLLTFDVSFSELWMHITKAGYWLIPIVGVWFLVYGINAVAWRCVINGTKSEDEHVSFVRIFRLTITGYALNYATPVGGLGGEPYRIMELSRDISKEHATSSVILYAMMHFVAHFWLWFTSVFLYFALAAGGHVPMTTVVGCVLGITLIFCLAAFYVFAQGYRHGVAVTILKILGKIPGIKGWSRRFAVSHKETLQHIDERIAALHKRDKKAFYSSLALEYLSRIVQSTEILFMLLLFGADCGGDIVMTFFYSVLILSFMSLFANIIGWLPMQLGVQEGGFVISIAALGLSAALGIFVSIICRVREIIWILIGILLMKVKS